jgi:energy-coupling factor transporter ATP-binding protein EcfA2
MIILLKGTSGSGKTTIVNRVMEQLGPHTGELELTHSKRQKRVLAGYTWRDSLAIIGRYGTPCSGCDSLSWPGVATDTEMLVRQQHAARRNVLFEGLMVSSWGGDRLLRLGSGQLVVIHLNTSLEDCLGAVAARRAARGDTRPLDPFNTTKKYNGLLSTTKAHLALGINVEIRDRASALARVQGLLGL